MAAQEHRIESTVSESTQDWILHVDVDQFQAAVEVLRRPDLVGRPVIVGGSGDPTARRQVVTCASYEARICGVRAGLPLRSAVRKCPDAVFLPTDAQAYERASAHVMATLRELSGAVEVWGWDEAFVATGTADPERYAATVVAGVLAATGLQCSVGIGDNKLRAKVATGFAKPAGIHRLSKSNWMAVMGDRPVVALWGVGRRGAARFADHGILTVAQLAGADPGELASWLGPTIGPRYRQLALGEGDRHLRTEQWSARSRSHQATFPTDLTDRVEIEAALTALAREVTKEVAANGRQVARVAVTVRNSSFFTESHGTTLDAVTTESVDVEAAALGLLDRFPLSRPVRLLGVRVELTPE